jgi:hypothetical protein
VARRKTPIEVDLSVIEELADGDSAELAGLIAMFNRHMADGIEQVRAAIETCELASVARVAHTCIGFTLTLGIRDSALVGAMGARIRAGTPGACGTNEPVRRCVEARRGSEPLKTAVIWFLPQA